MIKGRTPEYLLALPVKGLTIILEQGKVITTSNIIKHYISYLV